MPDRYKILGQLNITGYNAAGEDLYEVPEPSAKTVGSVETSPEAASLLTRTLVTSIVCCPVNSVAQGIWLRLVTSGGTTTNLCHFTIVAADDVMVLSPRLTMSPGDKLTVTSFSFGGIEMDVTCMGVESVGGSGPG